MTALPIPSWDDLLVHTLVDCEPGIDEEPPPPPDVGPTRVSFTDAAGDPTPLSDDAWYGTADDAITRTVPLIIEVLNARRQVHQIADLLVGRALAATLTRLRQEGCLGLRYSVRAVRRSQPEPRVAELTLVADVSGPPAVMRNRRQCVAIAARIEVHHGAWRYTALSVLS